MVNSMFCQVFSALVSVRMRSARMPKVSRVQRAITTASGQSRRAAPPV
nr:hypothetical protein [Nocardia wallacei]